MPPSNVSSSPSSFREDSDDDDDDADDELFDSDAHDWMFSAKYDDYNRHEDDVDEAPPQTAPLAVKVSYSVIQIQNRASLCELYVWYVIENGQILAVLLDWFPNCF